MLDYEFMYKKYHKYSVWTLDEFENFCKEWDDICKKLNVKFRKEVSNNEHE